MDLSTALQRTYQIEKQNIQNVRLLEAYLKDFCNSTIEEKNDAILFSKLNKLFEFYSVILNSASLKESIASIESELLLFGLSQDKTKDFIYIIKNSLGLTMVQADVTRNGYLYIRHSDVSIRSKVQNTNYYDGQVNIYFDIVPTLKLKNTEFLLVFEFIGSSANPQTLCRIKNSDPMIKMINLRLREKNIKPCRGFVELEYRYKVLNCDKDVLYHSKKQSFRIDLE